MPSFWQYLCCLCDSKNDKRQLSARYEQSNRRQNNRRMKSGKNTWARRSLLDNEQIQLEEIPTQLCSNELAGDEMFKERMLDQFTQKKRPTVYNVFEKSVDERSTSKTTFPWMDERFVPNARNGTRLGISSVQINAKRNETAKQQNNTSQNQNLREYRPHAFINSKSFTERQDTDAVRNRNPVLKSEDFHVNTKIIQNGNVLQNDINTTSKINNSKAVRSGVSSNFSEKPIILKAPTSDVGIRKIVPKSAHLRQDRVPKLEDFTSANSAKLAAHEKMEVGNFRPRVMDIFPNTEWTKNESEAEADVSFSSEVIFRKQPSEYSGSDVSLKRSAVPGMFSSKASKYDRLKTDRSNSQMSKSEKQTKPKPKYSNLPSSESMYGYVPKAVQNVHASNALEGTKIDDFFMHKMREHQLENFGSLDYDKECEDDTIIITTLVENEEDLTTAGKSEVDKVIEPESTRQTVPFALGGTVGVNNKELTTGTDVKAKLVASSDSVLKSTVAESVSKTNVPIKESNAKHTSEKDENESIVIMIDFPPNTENEKFSAVNNSKLVTNPHVTCKSSPEMKSKVTGGVLY